MTFESFKQSRQAAENFTEHHPVDELLGRAGIRPLVVFGANYKIVKPAALNIWRQLAGANIHVITDAGNDAPWEQPQAVADPLERFAESRHLRGCQPSTVNRKRRSTR
jgi:pimeloyl-ACP methyl ester carboxylesterase